MGRPTSEAVSEGGAAPSDRLGERVLRPRNVASFLLALVVLFLVYRSFAGLDWRGA